MSTKRYIVGNWKMNHSLKEIEAFWGQLRSTDFTKFKSNAWIAPQGIHLGKCLEMAGRGVKLGAQNCHHKLSGAFTGEASPQALKDMGAEFVIIGHSERRAIFKESHEELNLKVKTALELGLKVIFCVGETLQERNEGRVFAVNQNQIYQGLKGIDPSKLSSLIVAYEPVWAIGTGVTASPEQAEEVHHFLRDLLGKFLGENSIPLLYGGSVKPANIKDLLSKPNIDGGLVGGASLKASDFLKLVEAAG